MKNIFLLLTLFLCVSVQAQNRPSEKEDTSRIEKHDREEKRDSKEEHEREEQSNEKKNLYANTHSSWYKEMMRRRPNIKKAEVAFGKYFRTHPDRESSAKERFESWVGQARLYMDRRGYALPIPAAGRAGSAVTGKAGLTSGPDGAFGTWTMIGPTNMSHTECDNNNTVTGGFCDRVYVNPYNTQNLFAGFSYGGLWVSTDQGSTWQLTDGSFANGTNTYANRDYYYGQIKANPLNSSLVFAATEAGLLKSVNGGLNWTLCPTLHRDSSNLRPYYISQAVTDQTTMLSTYGQKVYRSTDAGTTWTMVFDNSGGGRNHTYTSQYNINTAFGLNDRTYNFFGLEADYSTPGHYYLGVWNSSNQACIYQSTDGGTTFSLLANLNMLLNASWGASTTLCLKTIPSSPSRFFVYEQFATNKPYYKFSSSGTLLDNSPINTYPEGFAIDWTNENTLYQGQYGVYSTSVDGFQRSTDGGATFNPPSSLASGVCNYLHPDIRDISAVGNVVLVGSDGGLALSLDTGATITGTGFGINSMDMWGFSSSRKSDICLTGLDHNEAFVRRHAGTGGWLMIGGADAGGCTVNPYNDRWLYYNTGGTDDNKGYLNADGSVTASPVSHLPDMGSLEFHPYLTGDIYGIQVSNNTIVVHSTDNLSTATPFHTFGSPVNMMRIARRDPNTMYVLLNQSTIQRSSDSGATWVDITPPASTSGGQTNITAIEVGKTPGELWAAYGNAQNTAKVLHSTDGGNTWTNITTSNLPAAAVSSIAYQRGTDGGVYISIITAAGTTVWYRNNTMDSWQQLGNTLPMMGYIQGRLYVVPAAGKIRFGSSRGAWESSLYEPSIAEAGIAADTRTFGCNIPDSIQFYDASAYAPGTVSFSWQFPGGSPATSTLANPKISYTTTPGTYPVTLIVTTPTGSDTVTIPHFIYYDSAYCCTGNPPAQWTFSDIAPAGLLTTPSTLCYTGYTGNYQITSNAPGLRDAYDAFPFLYQPLAGNGMITARVKDLGTIHNNSAGVMMRNSLSPNAAFVYLSRLDKRGIYDQWRSVDSGAIVSTTPGDVLMWMRLVRRGTSVNSFYSTDGTTWMPYRTYNVAFNDTVYVGIACTEQDNVANIDSVQLVTFPPYPTCAGGSASGCPAFDTVPGKALNIYDWATIYAPVKASPTNTFTITGWIKPWGMQSSQSAIMGWDQGNFYLSQDNDNQLEYVWNSTGSNTWNSGLFAQPNQWSFVAMVIHPDSATLYLNDQLSTNPTPQGMSPVMNTMLGNAIVQQGFYMGAMDEMTVWNRALDTYEIDSLRHLTREKLANPNLGSFDPSLLGYFQFNDSSSTSSFNLVDGSRFNLDRSASGKITSNAPVGGGVSALQTVNGPGTYTFENTGVTLTFPNAGAYPNGDIWMSRLNTLPDQYPASSVLPGAYWIMDNYGADTAFAPISAVELDNAIAVTAANADTPSAFRLFTRPVNSDGFTWGKFIDSAAVAVQGTPGSVIFDPAGITRETQLFINRPSVNNGAPKADTVAGRMLDLTPDDNPVIPLSTVPINSSLFTITMWVKPHGLQPALSQLISCNTPNSFFGIGFSYNSGNGDNLNLTFSGNAIYYWKTSSINLNDDQWNHIALTYTPTSVSIYLNGGTPWTVQPFSVSSFSPIDFTKAPVMVNADLYNQGGNYKGQIDEICFYNYVLSQQEIREKMHLTNVPGSEAGLVGYYQFNQYDTNTYTLYDAMGNGNASSVPAMNIVPSTAPVASGSSFRIPNVTTSGDYTFTGTGATLHFPGPIVPNGEMVVSRLNSLPDSLPAGYGSAGRGYWIIHNWGTNTGFTPMTLQLQAPGIAPADTSKHPQLLMRDANAFGNTWTLQCSAATVTSAGTGTATFNGDCNDTTAGQFYVGLPSQTASRAKAMKDSAAGISFNRPGTGADSGKFVRIIPNPVGDNEPVILQNLGRSEAQVDLYLPDGRLYMHYVVAPSGRVLIPRLPKGGVFYRATNKEGQKTSGVEIVQ